MDIQNRRRRHYLVIALLGLLAGACSQGEPEAAPFVEDQAHLLTAAEEDSISSWHAALFSQYDVDYRVLTVESTDDLSALAVRSFEAGRVGSQSRSGRGLMLVVDAAGERSLGVAFEPSDNALRTKRAMVPLWDTSWHAAP